MTTMSAVYESTTYVKECKTMETMSAHSISVFLL